MNQLIIQRTRYVLRSRIRKVQTCPASLFVLSCKQLINWIDNHQVLSGISSGLDNIAEEQQQRISKTMDEGFRESELRGTYYPGRYHAVSFEEHAAICFSIINAIADIPEKSDGLSNGQRKDFENLLIRCFGEYLTDNSRIDLEDAIESIRDVAVDGLFEYLDEHLDTRNAIFAVLLKYKQRSEWFHKDRLNRIVQDGIEGRNGERALALDLHEYILDQGVEFVVEPVSASGEADVILRDSDGRYIIVDAKYVAEVSNRSNIIKTLASGFNQVFRYCNDFNETFGFLIPISFYRH